MASANNKKKITELINVPNEDQTKIAKIVKKPLKKKVTKKKSSQARKLTEKQKRFIDHYLICGNATEAAIKAGYSKKNARQIGSENLSKLDSHLTKRLTKKEDKRIAKAEEVLEFFTKAMRGEIDEDQVVVESTGNFTSKAGIIKKQITPKDRIKAAENLAKRFGLLTEKFEVTTKSNVLEDLVIQLKQPKEQAEELDDLGDV